MNNIGININTSKDKNQKVLKSIIETIRRNKEDIDITLFKDSEGINSQTVSKLDMMIVLGGDGTILRTSRKMEDKKIPILGINIGHLGFLTNVTTNDFSQIIRQIFEGDFSIEERMRIKCKINNNEIDYTALNDVVLARGILSRIINFSVYIDENYYSDFVSDGIIISTPTGSTAYNLSAGGPIIHSKLDVITVTPICPHSINMKSIVLDSKSTIKIKPHITEEELYLTLDGQEAIELKKGDEITISISKSKCKFIKLQQDDYFKLLREKIIYRN